VVNKPENQNELIEEKEKKKNSENIFSKFIKIPKIL